MHAMIFSGKRGRESGEGDMQGRHGRETWKGLEAENGRGK